MRIGECRIGSQKGGITVFQCIILTALLLFFGVMIDLVRIILAEKEVQSALNSATRSVLAGYDSELVGDYGLFALDTVSESNSIQDDFEKYLSVNLQLKSNRFGIIKYELDKSRTSISGYRSILGNEDNVFKEQILKYMKYKAPLNATRTVVDKFVASGIFKKKEFAGKEKQVREERQEIKLNVDRVNDNIKSANSTIGEVSNYAIDETNGREYLDKLKNLKINFSQSDNTIGTTIQDLEAYHKVAGESEAFARNANKEEALDGEAEIKVHKREFGNANETLIKTRADMKKGLQDIDLHLSLIEPLQNDVESLSSEINTIKAANSSLTKENESVDKGGEENRKDLEKVIEDNNKKIQKLQNERQFKLQQMNNLKGSLKVGNLQEVQLKEAENKPEEAPKQDNNKSSTKLTETQKSLDKLLGNRRLENSWLIDEAEFTLNQRQDSKKYEELNTKEVPTTEDDLEKAEMDNDSIFAFMDKVEAAIQNGAKNIYVVEYIMDRFSYHTSITERDHYFQKGEIEYILWGGNTQKGNIASNMAAIGFLRFAVNTIDYFATSKVPHPVYRLVYSVGKGMLQAFTDCYNLYVGQSISICPTLDKSGFKLNYADHLRVFLMIQAAADEKGQLNNMRQLIQVNTKRPDTDGILLRPDFKFSDYNTILDAEVTVKANLWFLPLLQLDKLGVHHFEGGKYVISKEIHLGY